MNLALQGGGAHGAFTWGVLDRLLDEEGLEIGWISGTSAGAVNAVALSAGMARGGRAGARDTLRRVWEAVQDSAPGELARLNPFLAGMSRPAAIASITTVLSPYHFNPLRFDPLRRLLAENVDFAAIRRHEAIELLVAATEVETGRKRLFRRAEMSLETVLASACLPTLHHAVEIDGRRYWDGGFTANPELQTLAVESPHGDTLLVVLNPMARATAPRSAREIAAEVTRITFNAPLVREIEAIEAARTLPRPWWRGPRGRLERLAAHRFHLIDAGPHTAVLSADTKLVPDPALMAQLFTAGRQEMQNWLNRHGADIGRRESQDLGTWMRKPLPPPPVRTPEADAPVNPLE